MIRHVTIPLWVIVLTACPCAFPQGETTLGGYGELHYNEPDGTARGQLDFHRFVLYLGHSFNDRIVLRAEVELEHTLIEAGEEQGGALAIEQAFLDYSISPALGVRGGILLIPVGIINLFHEPPTFNGVERPAVDRVILPTTWREAGAGLYGTITDALSYQVYLVAGLHAEGFTAANGIRGGRQKAFNSDVSNPSITARIDYAPLLGLSLAGSFFTGNSTGGVDTLGAGRVTLVSGNLRYAGAGYTITAVTAYTWIGDTDKINRQFGNNVAHRMYGYYLEGAYDLLRVVAPDQDHELFLFARYEKYNTQAAVLGSAARNQHNRHDVVVGFTYKPTYNVSMKLDYTLLNNAVNAGPWRTTKQLNLGIGYYF